MATVKEIKAQCELFEQQQLPIIQKVQTGYFSAHKKYFQGIATPDKLPDDGKTLSADYTKKPTDQKETWAEVFKGLDVLPAKIPARTAIHVYEGPKGWGYLVELQFYKEDTFSTKAEVYTRTWDYGPEGRSTDWVKEDWDGDIHPGPEVVGVIRPAWSAITNKSGTVWEKTKRYASVAWEAVKHPIKTLQRRA